MNLKKKNFFNCKFTIYIFILQIYIFILKNMKYDIWTTINLIRL